jgi:hypothetical protein
LYSAIAKAADHRLMLDIHDEFRPTGVSRTYPNLLTQEGIRGNEEFPDAAQGTILPFTRMLAGAGDHTFCWLDPRLKNTWGYQLAHAVVIYSPLQFLYWYDRPAAFTSESAGMEWFKNLPTVWDDTRVLDGHPGSSSPSRDAAESGGSSVSSRTTRAVRFVCRWTCWRPDARTSPISTWTGMDRATSGRRSGSSRAVT